MNPSFFQYTIPIGNPRPEAAVEGGMSSALFRPRILPLFMPFAGCPHRCLFCAQDRQTGHSADVSVLRSLALLLQSLEKEQQAAGDAFRPAEIAFYGGTFTALPDEIQLACLEMTAEGKNKGLVCRVRCSTRPDALHLNALSILKNKGLDLVELGVQSFHTGALEISQRGYTGETARKGCGLVTEAGLDLGIQLLPGMPGSTPERFLEDAREALAFSPACLRFYPCLVVDGTPLAFLWKKGGYEPWDTETTISALGAALAQAWERRIPVIRLSVAPERSLDDAVLAGPRHPALGNLIQGEALLRTIRFHIEKRGCPPDGLSLPRSCQGFFFGHKKSLVPQWKNIGIDPTSVRWIAGGNAILYWNASPPPL